MHYLYTLFTGSCEWCNMKPGVLSYRLFNRNYPLKTNATVGISIPDLFIVHQIDHYNNISIDDITSSPGMKTCFYSAHHSFSQISGLRVKFIIHVYSENYRIKKEIQELYSNMSVDNAVSYSQQHEDYSICGYSWRYLMAYSKYCIV